METREVLLDIGNWIQAAGLIPSAYFVISYGIMRPIQFRKNPEVEKWWQSGVGTMFLLLGFALLVTNLVIFATLAFGVDYPGRELFRLVGYALVTVAVYFQCIVYVIERKSAQSILMSAATRARRERRAESHTL